MPPGCALWFRSTGHAGAFALQQSSTRISNPAEPHVHQSRFYSIALGMREPSHYNTCWSAFHNNETIRPLIQAFRGFHKVEVADDTNSNLNLDIFGHDGWWDLEDAGFITNIRFPDRKQSICVVSVRGSKPFTMFGHQFEKGNEEMVKALLMSGKGTSVGDCRFTYDFAKAWTNFVFSFEGSSGVSVLDA